MPPFDFARFASFDRNNPINKFLPQANQADPTVVEQNQNLLPQTPKTSLPSLTEAVNRELANRPERTRLRDEMEAAPQRGDYQPNKMTRLGAILGGASAGFRDPGKGVELAQSILDRPYNEANQAHETRLRNLSALAGMEGDDLKSRIQGVLAQGGQNQWEAGQAENIRQYDTTLGVNKDQFRQTHDLNEKEYKLRGFRDWTNKKTGHAGSRSILSGENFDFGQLDMTPEEDAKIKTKFFKDTQGFEGQEDRKSRETIANIGGETRKEVARITGENRRLLNTAISMGAKEATLRTWLRVTNESNNPMSPLYGLNPSDYVSVDPLTGAPTIRPDSLLDPAKMENAKIYQLYIQSNPEEGKGADTSGSDEVAELRRKRAAQSGGS